MEGTDHRRNWGRWGVEDERGALNLLTPERVLSALGAVRRGDVVSLAQRLERDMPSSRDRHGVDHYMVRDGGDYRAGGATIGRSKYADDVVTLSTHAGTHVDALAHVWHGAAIYNGFSEQTLRSRGAARCGADKLGPLVGRGILVDVAAFAGLDPLPADFAIDASVLAECVGRHGVEIEAGDIVLLRTGWLEAHGADDRYFDGEPGLSVDGAAWLADRDVAAVGSDNYAIEILDPRSSGGFPVHELLLCDCGIPLIENLDLGELASRKVNAFLFVANPLPIRGGTAGPLAPVAVI